MFEPSIDRQVPLTLLPGLEYGRASETPLLLDLVLPQEPVAAPLPAAIWLHGGGWYAGSRTGGVSYWCALLAAHGFVAVSVDYRLSGEAAFPAQIHDVKAAIRWLRTHADTYHVDPDRIGIWGHSAGGHLAALAAVTGDQPDLEGTCGSPDVSSRVQAAAIGSAHSDFLVAAGGDGNEPVFTQLFGGARGEREELVRFASPLTHVHSGAPPFLIAHGTLDETVPFDQAERLRQALSDAQVPVEFVPIEGGYHNWNPRPDSTWPDVRYLELAYLALRFFEQTL